MAAGTQWAGGERSLSKLEILGGDMARPGTQNLALPIFDFAPPLNANRNHPKTGKTMGGFPNPPTMES
jgi:hypothetical protein